MEATWYCSEELYDDVLLALKSECGRGACITVAYFDDQVITQNVLPFVQYGLGMGESDDWRIECEKVESVDGMSTLKLTQTFRENQSEHKGVW